MALRMHAERTADPDVIQFVIRDLPLRADSVEQGRFTPSDLSGLPLEIANLIAAGHLDEIVVLGDRMGCRRASDAEPWGTLAVKCRDSICRALGDTDATDLARAAVETGIGRVAASHGGAITVTSATAERVSVRLTGACNGCPAAQRTLQRGLREDLNRAGLAAAGIAVE